MRNLFRLALACSLPGAFSCSSETGASSTQAPEGRTASDPSAVMDAPAGTSATQPSVTEPTTASSPSDLTPSAEADVQVDGGSSVMNASIFPNGVSRPRIMIIGDSIAAGPGCYKKYLLAELQANGVSNFDFVGEYPDDCGGGVMHSARSCTTASDYTRATFTLRADCGGGTFSGLEALMVAHRPDLLMLQLGVNDVWNGEATDNILANYSVLVQQASSANPNIVLAVAQIHQIRPTGADGEAVFSRAQALITALPDWARRESEASARILLADLWSNSDTAQTLDGVHPDDAGAQRMAHNWFVALSGILPAE